MSSPLYPRKIVIDLFEKLQLKFPELEYTKLSFISGKDGEIITKSKTSLGFFSHKQNCIYIINNTDKYWLQDCLTLVHEVAHALVFTRDIDEIDDHGFEWQKIACKLALPRCCMFYDDHENKVQYLINRIPFYKNSKNEQDEVLRFVKKYRLLKNVERIKD